MALNKDKIIADFAMTRNYCEAARMNGCSESYVRKLVRNNPESLKKYEQKKEDCALSMEDYIEDRMQKAQEIMDSYLNAMLDKDKIAGATLNQLSTAFGTVMDKFFGKRETQRETTDKRAVIVIPAQEEVTETDGE